MAIRKQTDLGNTGMAGDFWKMGEFQIIPGVKPGTLDLTCDYRLWLDQAAHESGKEPIRRIRRVRFTVDTTDPKLSQIEAAADVAALVETISPVEAVAAVEAREASPGRPAIEAVEAVEGVPGVRGGALEGGQIV